MNCLNIIKRYTLKAATEIVVDRHAPPKMSLVESPTGELMHFNDLLVLAQSGVLIELNAELVEQLEDGKSQQAFVRDVTALGYKDFDQIMQVLTINKPKE